MRPLALGLLLLAACGGSSTPADQLVGNWVFISSDGQSGIGLALKLGGAYQFERLALTSGNTGNMEIETGAYTATDSEITATPQQWTCAGPDPVSTYGYSFSGEILELNLGTAVLAMQRNTAPPGSGVLSLGCFDSAGAFTVAPLAPVSN